MPWWIYISFRNTFPLYCLKIENAKITTKKKKKRNFPSSYILSAFVRVLFQFDVSFFHVCFPPFSSSINLCVNHWKWMWLRMKIGNTFFIFRNWLKKCHGNKTDIFWNVNSTLLLFTMFKFIIIIIIILCQLFNYKTHRFT